MSRPDKPAARPGAGSAAAEPPPAYEFELPELPELDERIEHLSPPAALADDTPAAAPAGDAIPELTEVLEVPRYGGGDLPQQLSDVDWTALEARVRDHVLDRLLRRSELLLETRVREALRVSIERASGALATELHAALTDIVRELVARAVSEELARVHEAVARGVR